MSDITYVIEVTENDSAYFLHLKTLMDGKDWKNFNDSLYRLLRPKEYVKKLGKIEI